MAYLLDTNIVIFWLQDSPTLSSAVYAMMRDPQIRIVVSAVTPWELAIKRALRRLEAPDDLESILHAQNFETLQVSFQHAEAVAKLPLYHRDPFDRMLVAQAMIENLTLLTSDRRLLQYGPFIKLV